MTNCCATHWARLTSLHDMQATAGPLQHMQLHASTANTIASNLVKTVSIPEMVLQPAGWQTLCPVFVQSLH